MLIFLSSILLLLFVLLSLILVVVVVVVVDVVFVYILLGVAGWIVEEMFLVFRSASPPSSYPPLPLPHPTPPLHHI